MAAVASMECCGTPIDVQTLGRLREERYEAGACPVPKAIALLVDAVVKKQRPKIN